MYNRTPRRALKRAYAIRCEHDGLKMGEVKAGHLILRAKHHGETHIHIVALRDLMDLRDDCADS